MLPRWFSWVAFAVANVLIDIEVLFYLYSRDPSFHRHCHSLPIATGLGVVAGLLTFFASRRFSKMFPARWRSSPLWIPSREPRLLWVCLLSGIVGGVSHVMLDSIIHADILPFWPLSNTGGLFRAFRESTVYLGCLAAGLLGLAIWLVLEFRWPSHDQQGSLSESSSQDSVGRETEDE
jgi:hypothetical protein